MSSSADLLKHLAAAETAERLAAQPARLAQLAKLLLSGGESERAVDLAHRARQLAPDDPEVERIVRLVLGRSVPNWHRTILADEARNAAYDAALRRAIGKGSRVLDIGAGSGLLAMMAARAGAASVVSCEMNPAMAGVAAEIVERNGYADRITIVGKNSRDLAVGTDLAEPVDILVSEIVTNDLLAEDVLGCLEDAVGRLTRPDAAIIPSHGAVRIALAHYGKPASPNLASVQGFDLSPMEILDGRIALAAGNRNLDLRSEPADLFAFDFASGGPFDNHRASVTLTATGGPVNGIVQWIRLRMDAEGVYENRPGPGATSCWGVMFQRLPSVLDMRPGDTLTVQGARDRTALWMWVAPGR
ncbi:50S ribosomal protein L11 methyltransferase [Reyranella aquatilis]|uniref:50S ribosomal protein L11 methyltransferase n=1 Tax=Reyranella aquatilis TaxID=2035356 RepID=A0ABS8KVJ3_9HYPH|nr:50S ribosomal protein L11 methyltransferase [Reyranella aquatilis]MCC8429678.1 50S ribosomal protein L11 methyltransferase [Reyranella aquatilis]